MIFFIFVMRFIYLDCLTSFHCSFLCNPLVQWCTAVHLFLTCTYIRGHILIFQSRLKELLNDADRISLWCCSIPLCILVRRWILLFIFQHIFLVVPHCFLVIMLLINLVGRRTSWEPMRNEDRFGGWGSTPVETEWNKQRPPKS